MLSYLATGRKEKIMKTVYDLTAEQLEELTFSFFTQLEEQGCAPDDIDEITEGDVFYHYHDMLFTDDDFFCTSPAKGVRPF